MAARPAEAHRRAREQVTTTRSDRPAPALPDGLHRLDLPVRWAFGRSVNAWAAARPAGFALFDTGMHFPGSFAALEGALAEHGRTVADADLVVCTHAHGDHYGQAGPIRDAAGCEVWSHPDHHHTTADLGDPADALARRIAVATRIGVPAAALAEYSRRREGWTGGVARIVEPDRAIVAGTRVTTEVGEWVAYPTPGHSPSHVCFLQPEHGLLISGDLLLERGNSFFDFGWTDDPVAEFRASLATVESLEVAVCLPGHGEPFTDVSARIAETRRVLDRMLDRTSTAVAGGAPTAYEVARELYRAALTATSGFVLISNVLSYLRHLERQGAVRRERDTVERWRVSR
ncbi:MBL fold metallo-hydrolase [Nocardia takedensis]